MDEVNASQVVLKFSGKVEVWMGYKGVRETSLAICERLVLLLSIQRLMYACPQSSMFASRAVAFKLVTPIRQAENPFGETCDLASTVLACAPLIIRV